MTQCVLKTMDGSTTTIGQEATDTLAGDLRGALLLPDSPDYDEARSIWNAMIDRRPGLIVECAGASGVGEETLVSSPPLSSSFIPSGRRFSQVSSSIRFPMPERFFGTTGSSRLRLRMR